MSAITTCFSRITVTLCFGVVFVFVMSKRTFQPLYTQGISTVLAHPDVSHHHMFGPRKHNIVWENLKIFCNFPIWENTFCNSKQTNFPIWDKYILQYITMSAIATCSGRISVTLCELYLKIGCVTTLLAFPAFDSVVRVAWGLGTAWLLVCCTLHILFWRNT